MINHYKIYEFQNKLRISHENHIRWFYLISGKQDPELVPGSFLGLVFFHSKGFHQQTKAKVLIV